MDEAKEKSKDLVQLARLALSGRPQDVQTYVLRMARKYQASLPELADQLSELLKQSPTRQSPLRGDQVASIPVDRDSRLHLLRHDSTIELEHEPIWLGEVRTSLEQLVAEHRHSDELIGRGLSPTRTALFTGPPGVGKTLAAKWIARELKRPLLTLDLSAVMSSFLGRTGSNVRHVLDFAKGVSCVLLLDELDAIAKRRDDAQEVGELKRLVTVLLQEIDDWPEGGLLVAASNHAELLDPAVWRRFEVQVDFGLPDQAAAREAVKAFLGADSEIPAEWMQVLSILLVGESFSDIERELKRLRRQAILKDIPLTDLLPQLVREERIAKQPKTARKEMAQKLDAAGLSQRQINELTGISRDTLRKLNANEGDRAAV